MSEIFIFIFMYFELRVYKHIVVFEVFGNILLFC
jgi:hypothetical protein